MSDAADPGSLQAAELRVRILRTVQETEKLAAETRKLVAEMEKYRSDRRFQPWMPFFQGTLAAAALLGAGVALAKLFLA